MLKFSRCSLRQLLFGVSVVLIALLDPIGLASSTDEASARWLNRLLASGYADDGQRQVVVVLVDDAYLLRNDTYWPLPYSEQSKLFKRLLAYKPEAVFVDLLYSHDHSRLVPGQPPRLESQVLANVFERYQQQGIALMLANNGLERGREGAVNTLPRLAEATTPALVSWSGYGAQYPLAVATDTGVLETPALRLYREYCHAHACASLPVDSTAAARLAPISVQWGVHPSPAQAQVADMGECTVPGLFDQLLQAVFWRLGSNAQAKCAYTLTLSASDLEVTGEEDQALIRQLLRGKLVLVGADIAGTGDTTLSPLHGQVPGVYLHAMALDNLINWGMGYYRAMPTLAELGLPGTGSIDLLDMIELLLLGLITYLKGTLDAPLFTPGARRRTRLRLGPASAWVVVLVSLSAVSAVLWQLNYTPVNVLGLLLLSLTLFSARIQAFFDSSARSRLEFATQGTQR
ncbi:MULTISPECIES: CHASE2 domain-containing protein [unclassified Pseudomonas]|uniref:CHASE2 domain-containing protein n=1 Tax=unclassified Pseudomonas TaxID=196821 RepID=UPI002447D20B|nr:MULTISPECIES: CHASE2 domain-containing protein [unclassified Pseudomonas]MDH0304050.1 CHASE2 domain-containing protein [Pseudomonas sp. GD04091]MDH1987837.1 CHASE2 domain-containing protein [Pseudomonas sp. GD03689]